MPLLGELGGTAARTLRARCDSCGRVSEHGGADAWVTLGDGSPFPKGWVEQWVGGLAGKSLLISCPDAECGRRVAHKAERIRNDRKAVAEIQREVARSKVAR